MSASSEPKVLTHKASAAIEANRFVKGGADNAHITKASAASDKLIGVSMNAATEAEQKVETALNGGGARLKIGSGGCAFGDMLTADSDGKGIVTTTGGNRVGAMAMESGAENDVVAVEVVTFLI